MQQKVHIQKSHLLNPMSRKGQLRMLFQLTELKLGTRGEAGSKTPQNDL